MSEHSGNTAAFRDSISTVDKSGKRVWLYPRKPQGRYTNARTGVSLFLLTLFFTGPFLRIGGEPVLLLNVIERKFIIFGKVFWPQDFYLFVIASLIMMVFIVVFTVIYGRIFCGWVCPQTIFMEGVFRKIEYWIEGDYKKQQALDKAPWSGAKIGKKVFKHSVFYGIAFLVSNTFLAYMIGSEAILDLIKSSPFEHPETFGSLVLFAGVFYGVFARFREQVCTTVCPYGRLQGVLMDRNSVLVAYDYKRGEPRMKFRKNEDRENAGKGSCIDCSLCVDVCPTGIDIRNGTQMECISCTACIDACDFVMKRTGQPTGLIRHDSEEGIANRQPFRFTKRMMSYSAVLVVLVFVLGVLIITRTDVQTSILRTPGMMYQIQENGYVSNLYNYKVINKSSQDMPLYFMPLNFEGEIRMVGGNDVSLEKHGLASGSMFVLLDQQQITEPKTRLEIGVFSDGKMVEKVKTTFMAPVN
ncbi:cytochrome c oxidase accessory protein CcoG [Cytophagaceae bacterium ABcell3]|nr:cytochrome c oxidase accessory protein CcoG [Cytophagaceae bacterium ABcell3]